MPQTDPTKPDFLEVSSFTFEELATICSVPADWLTLHIEEGLLQPLPEYPGEWRFSSASLIRVKRIYLAERDFEAIPELAALVADMQEEIARLKQRIKLAGIE